MLAKVLILTILLLTLRASAFNQPAPYYSPLKYYAQPFYTNLTYTVYNSTGTGATLVSSTSGVAGNDPVNQQFAFDAGLFKTFVNVNETFNVFYYNGIPVLCLSVPGYTYSFEVNAKSFAVKTDFVLVSETATGNDLIRNDVYTGYVNDPGAGLSTKIGITAYVDVRTGQISRSVFAQNYPVQRRPDGSCPPFTSMYLGQIDFEESLGSAPASFYQVPSVCANAIPYEELYCL